MTAAVPSSVTGTSGWPPTPSLVAGVVSHARRVAAVDSFRYRSVQWFVDVDALPVVRVGRARYDIAATDHLRSNGFRVDLAVVLADGGLTLGADDRILLLTHPRTSGRVFDPLSVFWVLAPDGGLRCAVLEVHNTYGERHAYLMPGDASRQVVDKDFYVSPFNDTSGEYHVRMSLTPERIQVTVNLHRDGELVLAATVGGPVEALTAPAMRRAARTVRGRGFRVPALIRWRGIRLWARRLPVQPRPADGGNLSRR